MSSAFKSGDRRETFRRLVREKPLAHPGVSSVALHDFDHAPPEHLRTIYGDIYRAMETRDSPQKLGYFLPREHGKSVACAVVVPTWAVLDNPNTRTLLISETSTQARKKLQQAKEVITEHASTFGIRIQSDNSTQLTVERSVNHAEPTIEAAGMGKSITGGHYDLIVFDDIVSWGNQRTDGQREKARKRFQDYLNLGSEGETTFVVVGTRKHPKDLYGDIIANPVWATTVRRAISDWSVVENEAYELLLDSGRRVESTRDIAVDETIVRVIPERQVPVLWPERWPLSDLLEQMLASDMDGSSLVWQRENQNDPSVMEGQILSAEMLSYVEELPDSPLSWFAGIDPALEADAEKAATQDTDYWGVAIIAHDRQADVSYLVDVARKRGMTLKGGIEWVQSQLDPYDIGRALCESNQAQRWFVQTARDMGLRVAKTTSSGGKEDRIISMASQFENRNVVVVAGESDATWESFESEFVRFPSGDHDDRLDAVEVALRNAEDASTVTSSSHDLGDVFG